MIRNINDRILQEFKLASVNIYFDKVKPSGFCSKGKFPWCIFTWDEAVSTIILSRKSINDTEAIARYAIQKHIKFRVGATAWIRVDAGDAATANLCKEYTMIPDK